MRLEEVPPNMHAVMCGRCGDYLALPVEVTEADRHQFIRDHHALCPARPVPCPCQRCGDEA